MAILKSCNNYTCIFHRNTPSGCSCKVVEIGTDGKCGTYYSNSLKREDEPEKEQSN